MVQIQHVQGVAILLNILVILTIFFLQTREYGRADNKLLD